MHRKHDHESFMMHCIAITDDHHHQAPYTYLPTNLPTCLPTITEELPRRPQTGPRQGHNTTRTQSNITTTHTTCLSLTAKSTMERAGLQYIICIYPPLTIAQKSSTHTHDRRSIEFFPPPPWSPTGLATHHCIGATRPPTNTSTHV